MRHIAPFLLTGLLGAALALLIFPADFLWPVAGLPVRPAGDAAQHAIAQRYLIADAWRWPPTLAANLNTQEGGLNTAFADAIPLLALTMKAVRSLLPEGLHGIGLWYALGWVAQPWAAIWALRGTGEQRVLPLLAIGIAALSMPAWIGRFGHAALTGHFLLLLGLGFYLRLVARPSRGLWLGAGGLQVAALLVHPYLAAMTLALLGAVPATRLLRGQAFLGAGLAVAAAFAAVLGVMAGFGYLGAQGDGGYGRFAMNLLSPVWPAGSWILGIPWSAQVDATGHGGWEGYNWLGLGLVLVLVTAAPLRPRAAFGLLRRHGGLALVLLALTLLAVTHRVGLGARIVLDLGEAPEALEQFRASGRFFWPVAYALLVGGFAALARLPRLGPGLCLVLALVQFADAAPLRRALATWAGSQPPWSVDVPGLRDALAEARSLTLLPSWPCVDHATGGPTYTRLLEVLSLASERAVPASTMYVARWRTPPACWDAELAAAPFRPGELRVILPAAQAELLPLVPGTCRFSGTLALCGASPSAGSAGAAP